MAALGRLDGGGDRQSCGRIATKRGRIKAMPEDKLKLPPSTLSYRACLKTSQQA